MCGRAVEVFGDKGSYDEQRVYHNEQVSVVVTYRDMGLGRNPLSTCTNHWNWPTFENFSWTSEGFIRPAIRQRELKTPRWTCLPHV